jgi:hypothetical protein
MSSLYYTDFYAWTQEQAELLRSRKWDRLDTINLVEEIESLGRAEKRELRNRLEVLMGHLLKWQYQPEGRGKSWRSTIREQRRKVNQLLQENPSLKPYLAEAIAVAYESAKDLAVRETDRDYDFFPESCQYTTLEILSTDFLPDLDEL